MSIEVRSRPYRKNFSGNPVYYELYSANAAADNSIVFEIKVMYKAIGGVYTEVITLPWAHTNGTAKIDVKDILHSQLEYGIPPFFDDEKTIWECTSQSGYFYLQFREITTLNPDPSWDDSEKDYECFILKGGINYFKHRGNNYWVNYFEPNNPFLTWQLSGRLAAVDERMYLAWLGVSNAAGLSSRVKIYYVDGTSSAYQDYGFPSSNMDVVYYIPVGCRQLDLENVDAAKQIWYWTVQVVDVNDNTAYSELFKFELDNRFDSSYILHKHHYRNSLGGLDSYRVLGDVEKKLEYDFTQNSKTVTPDYYNGSVIQPQVNTSDNKERQPNTGNIGDLSKEEQDRLRDAFVNRETYQEIDKKWIPLIVTIKSSRLYKAGVNGDSRFSLAIEWEFAYEGGEYYTPLNAPLGDGVFTSNVCRAYLTPMTVARDPLNGGWGIQVTENDPQNASEKYRYRVIKNSDGSVVVDWTEVFYNVLPNFNVPDDSGVYTLETQAICTNTIYGKKSTVQFDSTTAGGGGTGGGGGSIGGGGGNSILVNDTGFSGSFTIKVNGVEVASGIIGAYNTYVFDTPANDGATVDVLLTDFTPSIVGLMSNGASYSPSETTAVLWRFTAVDIVDGMTITID